MESYSRSKLELNKLYPHLKALSYFFFLLQNRFQMIDGRNCQNCQQQRIFSGIFIFCLILPPPN